MAWVKDIHPDLSTYDDIERSKIGIEFLVQNIRNKGYPRSVLKVLLEHFEFHLMISYDQTS